MGLSCAIMSDSTCDLSPERAQERQVEIIDFRYVEATEGVRAWHEEQLMSLEPTEFYDVLRAGTRLHTSQPSQLAYEEAFERTLAAGMPAVLLCISSGLSGAYESALAALGRVRERHPDDPTPIYVVDSLCASTPLQLLVEGACDRRDEGWDAEQVYQWSLEARPCLRTLFMVESMEYLYLGGRMPKAAASIGGVLDARPLLSFDPEGRLRLAGVSRGRKKALARLARNFARHCAWTNGRLVVAIGDADAPEAAHLLKSMVERECPDAYVYRASISPAIGVHVGPGMVSCCFWDAEPTLR